MIDGYPGAAGALFPSASKLVKGFAKARVLDPLSRQMAQGTSPEALALAVSVGVTVGVLPLLGATTILCAIIAAALRLNQPAILVASYLAYPIQLALYLPFFEAGARLFGTPAPSFSLAQLKAELAADTVGTVVRYASANARAMGAWALLAAPMALLMHIALRALFTRYLKRGVV